MLGHCLEGEVDTRTLGDIVADEMNIRRKFSRFVILSGATDWDRTSNLRLRRPTLYPIELQSHLQSYRIISKKGLPRLGRSTTAFEAEPMGRNKAPDAKIGDRRTDDREKKSAGEKPAEHGRADLGQCLPALG